MIKEPSEIIVNPHKILDILLIAVSFPVALYIKTNLLPEPYRGLHPAPSYQTLFLLIIIIWYLSLKFFNMYASFRTQPYCQVAWKVIKASTLAMATLSFAIYCLKINDISRLMMGIFFILNISLLLLTKYLVYTALWYFRRKGFNFRNILIVGGRERARDVIKAVVDHMGSGYRIVGCLGLNRCEVGTTVVDGIKYIDTLEQLKSILVHEVVDEIIFALPLKLIRNVETHITTAEELGVSVSILPDWQIHQLLYKPINAQIQIGNFLNLPVIHLTSAPSENGGLPLKTAFDYLGAFFLLIIFLPFFPIIAGLIKLSSRGPIFFNQQRCGLNGRKIIVYKFRTMAADAEDRRGQLEGLNELDGPVFKIKKDPRIIPFLGTFLRKTGLDELPQLLNVLKGEMSLVGPRPPIPEEVEKYDFWQRRRLSMKPGITCLWQCTLDRNDVCFHDWMDMDLKYIDNWSLMLDFKILLKTAVIVLTGQGR
jgi:exopolysaccharide biosynthesis polyprenyl glycosylphosphotransferase